MWVLVVVYTVMLPFTGTNELKDMSMVQTQQECLDLGKRIQHNTQTSNVDVTVSYNCVLMDDKDN